MSEDLLFLFSSFTWLLLPQGSLDLWDTETGHAYFQQICLKELAGLMTFFLSVRSAQILALQPVTQPDSANCRHRVTCVVCSQPTAAEGAPSTKGLQQAAFRKRWDCCKHSLLHQMSQADGKSMCSWFQQIIETFPCIFTQSWAFGNLTVCYVFNPWVLFDCCGP